jgi:hypothetical protein
MKRTAAIRFVASLALAWPLLRCSSGDGAEDAGMPQASAGNGGSSGAGASTGAGAGRTNPSSGPGGGGTAGAPAQAGAGGGGVSDDEDAGAISRADGGAQEPPLRGTGPGDWMAGDYPPDLMAQTYLEISGVDGQANNVRQYKVHVPPSYDPEVPMPAVFTATR